MSRRCLVLGARPVLGRVEGAIRFALSALELEQVHPGSPADGLEVLDHASVLFADVSEISPTTAYIMGAAQYRGLPAVYCAPLHASVAPIFEPATKRYDPNVGEVRLGFIFAKLIEDAQAGKPLPAPRRAADSEDAPDDGLGYLPGERFTGVVYHADAGGGFALVGSPGRRPGLLHVSGMSGALADALDGGRLGAGDLIQVEVVEVDPRRRQVRLKEVPSPSRADAEVGDPDLATSAELLSRWASVERILKEAPESMSGGTLQRLAAIFADELEAVRLGRNRFVHGESLERRELDHLVAEVRRLEKMLRETLADVEPAVSPRGPFFDKL